MPSDRLSTLCSNLEYNFLQRALDVDLHISRYFSSFVAINMQIYSAKLYKFLTVHGFLSATESQVKAGPFFHFFVQLVMTSSNSIIERNRYRFHFGYYRINFTNSIHKRIQFLVLYKLFKLVYELKIFLRIFNLNSYGSDYYKIASVLGVELVSIR